MLFNPISQLNHLAAAAPAAATGFVPGSVGWLVGVAFKRFDKSLVRASYWSKFWSRAGAGDSWLLMLTVHVPVVGPVPAAFPGTPVLTMNKRNDIMGRAVGRRLAPDAVRGNDEIEFVCVRSDRILCARRER